MGTMQYSLSVLYLYFEVFLFMSWGKVVDADLYLKRSHTCEYSGDSTLDKADCKAAASTLGYTWKKVITNALKPDNCFVDFTQKRGRVYYNKSPAPSSCSGNSRCVCLYGAGGTNDDDGYYYDDADDFRLNIDASTPTAEFFFIMDVFCIGIICATSMSLLYQSTKYCINAYFTHVEKLNSEDVTPMMPNTGLAVCNMFLVAFGILFSFITMVAAFIVNGNGSSFDLAVTAMVFCIILGITIVFTLCTGYRNHSSASAVVVVGAAVRGARDVEMATFGAPPRTTTTSAAGRTTSIIIEQAQRRFEEEERLRRMVDGGAIHSHQSTPSHMPVVIATRVLVVGAPSNNAQNSKHARSSTGATL
jgi:hypothetical protein